LAKNIMPHTYVCVCVSLTQIIHSPGPKHRLSLTIAYTQCGVRKGKTKNTKNHDMFRPGLEIIYCCPLGFFFFDIFPVVIIS